MFLYSPHLINIIKDLSDNRLPLRTQLPPNSIHELLVINFAVVVGVEVDEEGADFGVG